MCQFLLWVWKGIIKNLKRTKIAKNVFQKELTTILHFKLAIFLLLNIDIEIFTILGHGWSDSYQLVSKRFAIRSVRHRIEPPKQLQF